MDVRGVEMKNWSHYLSIFGVAFMLATGINLLTQGLILISPIVDGALIGLFSLVITLRFLKPLTDRIERWIG